jgi:hypothetical protein
VFSLSTAVFIIGSVLVTRRGEAAVSLRFGGLAALLLAGSFLLPVIRTSTGVMISFLFVRAASWAALSTIVYGMGARGADRAGVGRGAVLAMLNATWSASAVVGPLAAGALVGEKERAAHGGVLVLCVVLSAWMLAAARAGVAASDASTTAT